MPRRKLSTVDWVRVKEIYQKCARMNKFERKSFLEQIAEESPAIAEEAAFLLEQAGSAVSAQPESPEPFRSPAPSGPMAASKLVSLPTDNHRIELAPRAPEREAKGDYMRIVFVAFLIGVFVGGAMLLYPKWKQQREAASVGQGAIGIDE